MKRLFFWIVSPFGTAASTGRSARTALRCCRLEPAFRLSSQLQSAKLSFGEFLLRSAPAGFPARPLAPKEMILEGCKPNFVCVLADGENHLSQQPVPETRFACANTGAGRPKWFPIWPCTRWGFPCRVACASRGALLPHLFTLTTRLATGGGLIFCGTVRRKAFPLSARVYPRPDDRGYAASRPVEFGLSSPTPPKRDRSDSPPFQNRGEVIAVPVR